jgi:hypothetical protein
MWKTGYKIYHSAGPLCLGLGEHPSYAQLYFYDVDDVLHYHKRRNPNLCQQLLSVVQECLCQFNPFSKVFLHAHEVLRQVHLGNLAIRIIADPKKDHWRYNAPTVDEIAVLIVSNEQDVGDGRDIIL